MQSEPTSDFVPSKRKGTLAPPASLPVDASGSPVEVSTMDQPDPRFPRPQRSEPVFGVNSHERAIGRIQRDPVTASRRECLAAFAELFADASAHVLKVNEANGWWEDKEANEAASAVDALKSAASAGHVPGGLSPDFVNAIDLLGSVAMKVAERPPRNDFEAFFLMVTELAEAGESRRVGLNEPDDKIPEFSGIEAELADTVIRIMDMSAARGWRVGPAIAAKLEMNAGRGYRHGGKLA